MCGLPFSHPCFQFPFPLLRCHLYWRLIYHGCYRHCLDHSRHYSIWMILAMEAWSDNVRTRTHSLTLRSSLTIDWIFETRKCDSWLVVMDPNFWYVVIESSLVELDVVIDFFIYWLSYYWIFVVVVVVVIIVVCDSWTLTPRFWCISWFVVVGILLLMSLCFMIYLKYSMLWFMNAIILSIKALVSFIELLISLIVLLVSLVIWVVSALVSSIVKPLNESIIDRIPLFKLGKTLNNLSIQISFLFTK